MLQGLLKVPALGFVIPKNKATIYDSGDEPVTCTTGAAIGTAVANLLLDAEATANRFLKIRSLQVTQNQLLTAFEDVTGTKWEVTRVKTKDLDEGRKKKAQEGRFQEAFLDLLAVQLFEDGKGRGLITRTDESDNALLGVREEAAKDVIKRIMDSD